MGYGTEPFATNELDVALTLGLVALGLAVALGVVLLPAPAEPPAAPLAELLADALHPARASTAAPAPMMA
jgi:hypothetical protein